MRRRRLLWRIYPTYLLVTFLALFAIGWYSVDSLREFYYEKAATDLHARALLLEQQLSGHLTAPDTSYLDGFCKDLGKRTSTRITIVQPTGEVLGDTRADPRYMVNHADRPEIIEAMASGKGRSVRYSETLRQRMMYFAIPLREDGQEGSEPNGVLRLALPVSGIDDTLATIRWRIVLAGVVIALVAAGFGWLFSRRFSRPLEEMKRGAEHFAQGNLDHRLEVPESDEAASLAEAMNEMAAQLSERIRAMAEQGNKQEALLSSMVEGVVAVDSEENVITLNRAAAELFGVTAAEVQGRPLQEVARNATLQKFVSQALQSGGVTEGEILISGGQERCLQAHGTPLRNGQGREIGAMVVLNEVTRLRRLESVRRDFVTNVSHELKTPVTLIKGFVETLRDGALEEPDDAQRFLEIIAKQADRLQAIIEDLLSLSRIEEDADKGEIELETCKLRSVLQSAIQDCELKAVERDVSVRLKCPEGLMADLSPRLFEQAVVNLLDNAIKYSQPRGEVRVEGEEADSEILVHVSDNGCGIEETELHRIFERFYRVDKARSRKLGGTGLGLAIVKHIAQAHNGRVTVESSSGKGTSFTIHLPRAAAET